MLQDSEPAEEKQVADARDGDLGVMALKEESCWKGLVSTIFLSSYFCEKDLPIVSCIR